MDTTEETKLCPICGQQIAVSKFRMHQIGCAKYFQKQKEAEAEMQKQEEAEALIQKQKDAEAEKQKTLAEKQKTLVEKAEADKKKRIAIQQEDEMNRNLASFQKEREDAIKKGNLDPIQNPSFPQPSSSQPVPEIGGTAAQAQPQFPIQNQVISQDMDEYDQMIFKQYMEDLDAEQAEAIANGVNPSDFNNPMGGGNQMDPGLGIRKADSIKNQQLIGGDDDDFSYPQMPIQQFPQMMRQQQHNAGGMGMNPGMMNPNMINPGVMGGGFSGGMGVGNDDNMLDENQYNQFPTENFDPMAQNNNNIPMPDENPVPNEDEEMQKAIQASLAGLDNDAEAFNLESQADDDLARALEMSKNMQ